MAKIELVLSEEEVREEITRLLEGMGHRVFQSAGPPGCYELLRDERPRVLVTEESQEVWNESLRLAPLVPVIVCLKRRDANRALHYLQKGVFECVPPPWNREALAVPIRRALRLQGTGFSLAWRRHVHPWRRQLVAGTLLLLLVAGGSAYWRYLQRQARLATQPFSHSLPYRHPAGAVWRGGLWVGDWFSQSLYHHRPDLEIQQVYHLPGSTLVALTAAEGSLWIATAAGKWIRRVADEGLRVLGTYPASGPKTVGLCYDGLYLWSADGDRRKLYKHLLDDLLTVLEAFAYPGKQPAAIACDAGHLWSLDEGTGELLLHDLNRPDLVLDKTVLPEYAAGIWRPTGLAHHGQEFWTVAEKKKGEGGRVFRHRDPWASRLSD